MSHVPPADVLVGVRAEAHVAAGVRGAGGVGLDAGGRRHHRGQPRAGRRRLRRGRRRQVHRQDEDAPGQGGNATKWRNE